MVHRNRARGAWGFAVRWHLMAVALVAVAAADVTTAHAGLLGRWCREACVDEVATCVAQGGAHRTCRRELLGACKAGGFTVCAGTDPAARPTRPASSLRAPGSLRATAISSSIIDLSWADSNNSESSQVIERSLDPSFGFVTIASVKKNVTAYRDAGLAASTTYFYLV